MRNIVLLFSTLILTSYLEKVLQAQVTINFASHKQAEAKLIYTEGGQGAANAESTIIKGDVAYLITRINDDESTIGTLLFSSEKKSRVILRNVRASLKKGTSCPRLNIIIPKTEINMEEFIIEINETSLLREIWPPDQLDQMVCAWTRQKNTHKDRKGLITAINRIISPEK